MRDAVKWVLWLFCTGFVTACASRAPLPSFDFQQQGWQLRFAQAVWQIPGRPGVAGDLVIAVHKNGNRYVEMTKGPVSVFRAQSGENYWSLQVIDSDKTHRGKGRAPARFVWFYLPELLAGETGDALSDWTLKTYPEKGTYAIINSHSGETIRLLLDDG